MDSRPRSYQTTGPAKRVFIRMACENNTTNFSKHHKNVQKAGKRQARVESERLLIRIIPDSAVPGIRYIPVYGTAGV